MHEKKKKNNLNHSMPRLLKPKYGWGYLASVFAYIMIELNFQQPFSDYLLHTPHRSKVLFGFGGIVILLYLLHYLIFPRIFCKYFDDCNWTLKKEIRNLTFFFLVFLLVNLKYVSLCIPTLTDGRVRFLSVLHFTFTACLVPVFCVTFFRITYYLLKKEQSDEKNVWNRPDNTTTDFRIDLTSLNGKKYHPNDLYFFKVVQNYTFIIYRVDNRMEKDCIQASLIKVQELLADHPQFKKCKNSYVVNEDKISKCTGNKRSMYIQLCHCQEKIPVSRDFAYLFIKYKKKDS